MTTSEEYERYSADCMLASGEASDDERPVVAQLNAIGGVQQALLGIMVELRRSNDARDQWYREVLEVLTQAKDGDGSPVGSEQPAAAPECPVCGGILWSEGHHSVGDLTREQWRAHGDDFAVRLERVGANRLDAALWGDKTAENHFGPCPAAPSQQEGEDGAPNLRP